MLHNVHPGDGGRWCSLRSALARFGRLVWHRALTPMSVVLLAVVLAPTPANAATTLNMVAGYGGRYLPGQSLPVSVTISADRLVAGSLEVTVDDGLAVTVPVEVPGGSEKRLLVVVPTAPYNHSASVKARLLVGGVGAASKTADSKTVVAALNEELVGVLPGAVGGRRLPEVVPLAHEAGVARLTTLGEIELEQAPGSLGPLSTVVAGEDDLLALTGAARLGLIRWVASGGTLVLGAAPGDTVAGLPEGWLPLEATRMAADRGEIRLVGESVRSGEWLQALEATPRAAAVSDLASAPSELAFSLATEAGVRLASLSWLMVYLLAYVAIVVPVLYVVLRRRRRPELAWVAIPVIAVLFTTGAYIGGRGLRTDTQLVHASVLNTGAAGSSLTTFVGVTTRSGETVRLGFPRGWLPVDDAARGFGESRVGLLGGFTTASDGVFATLPLDVGQFGVMAASGPFDSGSLEVVGELGPNGEVTGTVRNGTGLELEQVGVLLGRTGLLVGHLEPGEERAFGLEALAVRDAAPPAEWQLWGRQFDAGSRGPVDLTLWSASSVAYESLSSGHLVAAGWTREFDPPVRSSGGDEASGRTLVLGHGVPGVSGAAVGPIGTTEVLRRSDDSGGPTLVRLDLPRDAPSDVSRLRLRSPLPNASVWDGSQWSPTACDGCAQVDFGGGFAGPFPPPATIQVGPLPPDPGAARAAIAACPPGAECGFGSDFGFAGNAFLLTVPAGGVVDGSILVRADPFAPPEYFGIELVHP